MAIAYARGWAANSLNARIRLKAKLQRLQNENSLLREELRIKDARMAAIAPRHRPHYRPTERMAILEMKAATGWSQAHTARRFLLEPATIASWTRRIDEAGPAALVRLPAPVNRFPDFVRHIVRRLKLLCLEMGKVKMAQTLARAGLHLAATTVGRMLKGNARPPKHRAPNAASLTPDQDRKTDADASPAKTPAVTAGYPGHVWHVDLTVVPTKAGFWTPWLPFAWPQVWPFCWWVAVVIDHFSRRVIGFAVFARPPSSVQVRAFLGRAIGKARSAPKYIICDKGRQFWCRGFKKWCKRRSIKLRYGAVGRHGSIAIIERFVRSLRQECLRRVLVPLRLVNMRRGLTLYVTWYNRHRPHQALGGRTPIEVYEARPPANRRPRLEPRPKWSPRSPCAAPQTKVRGNRGTRFELVGAFLEGRAHLPIVALKRVA